MHMNYRCKSGTYKLTLYGLGSFLINFTRQNEKATLS